MPEVLMHKLGVIPAAGLGSRWGFYPKFLLPCGEREWLLDRTIRAMPCDQVAVVYGPATERDVCDHIVRCNLQDKVILLQNDHMEWDFWGSMYSAMLVDADFYYFAMPDTYPDVSVFGQFPMDGISLGLHQTDNPQRFGMLRDGVVINKQVGPPGLAWGVLGWSRAVRDLWLAAWLESYTDAINLALQEFEWHGFQMEYYFDMASWVDYAQFVKVIS